MESEISLRAAAAEREQAVAALRSQDAQFREMAEVVPQLIWTSEPDGTLRYVNRRWRTYTGVAPNDWLDALHLEDHAHVAEAWTKAMDRAERFDADVASATPPTAPTAGLSPAPSRSAKAAPSSAGSGR